MSNQKQTKAEASGLVCPDPSCENGMIDCGGVTPWGECIMLPCPSCRPSAFSRLYCALEEAERTKNGARLADYADDIRALLPPNGGGVPRPGSEPTPKPKTTE